MKDIEDAACNHASDMSPIDHSSSGGSHAIARSDDEKSSSDASLKDLSDPQVFIRQSKRKWREDLEALKAERVKKLKPGSARGSATIPVVIPARQVGMEKFLSDNACSIRKRSKNVRELCVIDRD